MAIIGPGAQQEVATDIKPALDGASEYEYITLFNPLSDDFAVRVAQDIPVNLPFSIGKDLSGKTAQTTNSERDAAQTYGLSLKNPDFVGRKHIVNDTIIKAGGTINLKGNEAQVAVRQLVNEIMQREGNTRLMSDPVLRAEVESRVIRNRGNIQELMDASFVTPSQQATTAINRSNEVINEDPTLPGLEEDTDADNSRGAEVETSASIDQSSPSRVGRPKQTDS